MLRKQSFVGRFRENPNIEQRRPEDWLPSVPAVAPSSSTTPTTKAEFDTALTDGNFLYVGDITQYTDEMARDTIGATLVAGTNVTLTVNDGADTITIDVAGGGGGSGVDVEDEGVAEATAATTLNFTGAGVTATDAGGGVCNIDVPGGGGIPSGTSFPGSPSTNDQYYRTDRNIGYFYDGTRWLSTQLFMLNFNKEYNAGTSFLTADFHQRSSVPYRGVYEIWLERFEATMCRVGTGEWDVLLVGLADGINDTLVTLDGAGDTTSLYYHKSTTIGAVLSTTYVGLYAMSDEVSGSASFLGPSILHYRLIG
jgi:hypothetical protein